MALMKRTMKNIHQIAIKYLTYLVLNKRKLDDKQEPPPLHITKGYWITRPLHTRAHLP